MKFGFDISTYQDSTVIFGNVDFHKMRDYGASFVIIKAGQGDWMDQDFPVSWTNAKGVLPRASYWYYDNRYDPKEQAQLYWNIIRDDPEGICWLDLEDRQSGSYAGWRKWYDFIVEFQRLLGREIGIYTGFYYWVERMAYATEAQIEYWKQFKLWLASYPENPFEPDYENILIPPPWDKYEILQSGTPAIGLAAGVESKDIDYDLMTDTAFEQMFGQVYQEGESMTRYEATNLYSNMAFRPDHNTDNVRIGLYSAEQKWHGNYMFVATEQLRDGFGKVIQEVGDMWLQVTDINGAPKKGWVAIIHLGKPFCTYTDNGVVPPVEPTIAAIKRVLIDAEMSDGTTQQFTGTQFTKQLE